GLDLMTGKVIVACMGTAAHLYGFDTEKSDRIHILDPGVRMRPTSGLAVHQRIGAPLRRVEGRLATAPAWTAVGIARTLRRPARWPPLTPHSTAGRAQLPTSRPPSANKRGGAALSRCASLWSIWTAAPSRRWRAKRDWCSSTADYQRRSCSTKLSTAAGISGG